MRVLIVGSMNVGNIGDNLLGAILQEMVLRSDPNSEVIVDNSARIDLVDWADMVIVGPGGLIDDVVTTNVDNYLRFLRKAQKQNKINMLLGVGVQRLREPSAMKVSQEVLGGADFISVRSPEDAHILTTKAGVESKVYGLGDIAFMLQDKYILDRLSRRTKRTHFAKLKNAFNFSLKPKLGFSLMNWDFSHVDRNKIQSGLEEIAKNYTEYIEENLGTLTNDFSVVLICQSSDDFPLYEKLAKKYNLPLMRLNETSFENSIELLNVYKNLDIVLTGRFHGLIMAALTGKPTMNVSIGDHKQKKLIHADMPSLMSANFRLEQLYEDDLFSKFIAEYKSGQLPVADEEEVKRCYRLANINQSILDYYLSRASRTGGV